MTTRKLHAIVLAVAAIFVTACDNVDLFMATSAGIDAARAITLSDQAVQKISAATSSHIDQQHHIAASEHAYAQRLQQVLGRNAQPDTAAFNYKVYLTREVNAFAMADGTIRIFAGLMDMLNDEELLFVIGHEMGHVELKHIHEKLRLAYAASATRKAAASIDGAIGDLARSELGAFIQLIANAQFSQHEEREADDYGLEFLRSNGLQPQAAVSALQKLATLGSNHSFLSSHPAPEKRAERISAQIEGKPVADEEGDGQQGIFSRIVAAVAGFVKKILLWLGSLF